MNDEEAQAFLAQRAAQLALPLAQAAPQPALPSPRGPLTAASFGPPGGPRAAAALPSPANKQLPSQPGGRAIEKAFSPDAAALALPDANSAGNELRLSLPPAVAARLKSLLDRHESGKHLTAAERAEAQGLLDIAEYFILQRLRHRLAA